MMSAINIAKLDKNKNSQLKNVGGVLGLELSMFALHNVVPDAMEHVMSAMMCVLGAVLAICLIFFGLGLIAGVIGAALVAVLFVWVLKGTKASRLMQLARLARNRLLVIIKTATTTEGIVVLRALQQAPNEEKRVGGLQANLSRAVLAHRTASTWFGLGTELIYALFILTAAL